MPNSQRTRPGPHSAVLPPARTRFLRRALACLAAALIAAPITMLSTASPAAAETNPTDAGKFKGVNWAMPGDNFSSGAVVPEGLDSSDSYATVNAKANAILSGFQNTGANTVRLPINKYSVPGTTWGDKYTGAIDAATAKGFKVILAYWDGDGVGSNGRIVDAAAFTWMWKAVTDKYGSNGLVYFEPYNEPHGYSATDWANVAANWIASNPTIPKNRIIVGGPGDNDYVTTVCADSRLDGTYLSLHHYAFGKPARTYDEWVSDFKSKVGTCGTRTILDEFGAPMDTGLNYNDATSTDNFVRYLRADTDTARSLGMGAVYWPALGGKHTERPDYDWYSLFDLKGSGTNLTLGTRNITGIDRLKYAWGSDPGSHTSMLRNVGSNGCLDADLNHKDAQVQVYPVCWGGDNQQWTVTPSGQITVYGTNSKCLDAYVSGTKNGTVVGTYGCNGGDNQKWMFYSDGTIRGVQSGLCLDRDLDTSKVQLWSCWGGNNQKWQTS
ncbi:ricin-type beta-trefoil lectin domain protein [Streptomyces sp. TLI_185]|uniref:ricin-type beta-trefoil lectin domain protein n=1 Tax=Streptomyces sp. TLI_185 TaxID=2485151 RepID=UPI000F4F58E5|nr:ricin-type beta-trefoil lectin domain protein [Streptomyces sp. TLI_185]RPF39089.1 cellulase (glycosyl hydrolase family 5) [Streptomyces sp. TLI_185]